jgi:general stress protein 26
MDDPTLARLVEKFATAEACWFSSTRPDGRAHLAPIWHVWYEGRVYVVTQETAVRTHNITRNPAVSLSLPDTTNVLIIEGTARITPEQKEALGPSFKAKYNWAFADDNPYNVIIEVTPRKMIAWGADGDGRWHFDAEGKRKVESESI